MSTQRSTKLTTFSSRGTSCSKSAGLVAVLSRGAVLRRACSHQAWTAFAFRPKARRRRRSTPTIQTGTERLIRVEAQVVPDQGRVVARVLEPDSEVVDSVEAWKRLRPQLGSIDADHLVVLLVLARLEGGPQQAAERMRDEVVQRPGPRLPISEVTFDMTRVDSSISSSILDRADVRPRRGTAPAPGPGTPGELRRRTP